MSQALPARKTLLLLTATVNPDGMPFTRRTSPRKRLRDYRRALRQWSAEPAFDSIIFCENSGYDVSRLNAHRNGRVPVSFFSFRGNDYPRHLGKGFGEMNILNHALQAAGVDDEDLVLKVTGRYYAPNIAEVMEFIRQHQDCDVFCNLDAGGAFVHSGVFAATARFIREYLLPMQVEINDSNGLFFEHALLRAVQHAGIDGLRWEQFPNAPRIEGISGSTNRRYNPSRLRYRCDNAAAWLCQKFWYPALSGTQPVRSRIGLDRTALTTMLKRLRTLCRWIGILSVNISG